MDSSNQPRTIAAQLVLIAAISVAGLTSATAQVTEPSAVLPDKPVDWDMPALPLSEAAWLFQRHLGETQISVAAYDMDTLVGPFQGRLTPRAVWTRMGNAACASVGIVGSAYSMMKRPISGLNDVERSYDLPRAPLSSILDQLSRTSDGIPVRLAPGHFGDMPVGPVKGRMTMESALLLILGEVPDYTYVYSYELGEINVLSRDGVSHANDLALLGAKSKLCQARLPGPDEAIDWNVPQLPVIEAAKHFQNRIGAEVIFNIHGEDLLVGPIQERLTPRAMWERIIDAGCGDVTVSESGRTYASHPRPIPGYTDVSYKWDLPRASLKQTVYNLTRVASGRRKKGLRGVDVQYRHSSHPAEAETMVGPISGRYSPYEVLRIILAEFPQLRARLEGAEPDPLTTWLTIEPRPPELRKLYPTVVAIDQGCMRDAPYAGDMLVEASRLESLLEDMAGRALILERRDIDAIGVSNIPDLLRYLPQSAFARAAGYRLSGAQYAEGRGVGPAMVLINNQRTMASASSLSDSAFDLNTIPIAAVERIEFIPDTGSIVYGVDSVGGIVNIVLREPPAGVGAETRYGDAQGGAIERRLTALARTGSESRGATLIADLLQQSNLLGRTRNRYANQDYRRYGGPDRRSVSSAPGNLRSTNGQNIPGFDTPIVGLPEPTWGESVDADHLSPHPNLTSLLQYRSIAPARERASLVGTAKMPLGNARVSGNAIYTRQNTQYSLTPPTVQGESIASSHAQNPLDVPLLYFGLLNGLPSQQYEARSELFRGAGSIAARAAGWDWELSFVKSREAFEAGLTNILDSLAVTRALNPSDMDAPLDILAHRPGAGRTDLLSTPVTERFIAKASQVHLLGERDVPLLPAGNVSVRMGAEWRKEAIEFDDIDGDARRVATAAFLNLRIPLVDSLAIFAGARHDEHSDTDSVTSSQYGFEWIPTAWLKLHANLGERYRPPSLYELHLRPISIAMPVTDPKTQQTTVATIISGGRRNLDPTTAASRAAGFVLTLPRKLEVSLDYWQVDVQDRIGTLPLLTTLANEDRLPGRVTRTPASSAELPGSIQTIDISWQNLGALSSSGMDLSVRGEILLGASKLTPQLGVTMTTEYSSRELPKEVARLVDRVGVASESGTIPKYRLVGSLTWESEPWRVTTNVRYHPRYRDTSLENAALSYVSGQAIIDLNASRKLGGATVLVGAANLFDSEPDYSNISSVGYDTSQGDLRGRVIYGELKVRF